MGKDIRKMIDEVKNFKQFVNENEQHDEDSCEYCGYVYQKSADKLLHKDIIDMLKNGLSDTFIEAKLYGKYKYKFSMKDINNMIDKAKEHLSKSEMNLLNPKTLLLKKQHLKNPIEI